jgi:hypothetical protein
MNTGEEQQNLEREMKNIYADNYYPTKYMSNFNPLMNLNRNINYSTTAETLTPFNSNYQQPCLYNNQLTQNANYFQNLQSRMAYENMLNLLRMQSCPASGNNYPVHSQINMMPMMMNNQNFMMPHNYSGVSNCQLYNSCYDSISCQPKIFNNNIGSILNSVNINVKSDDDLGIKENNINNIIGKITSSENIIKNSEEKLNYSEEKNKRTKKCPPLKNKSKIRINKNSRKIMSCPHVDEKHYAKVIFFY